MKLARGESQEFGDFTSWLYRPYIDLGPMASGPSHIHCVEFAFENFQRVGTRRQRPQRVLPHSFRESLLRETQRADYSVLDPLELDAGLRSRRWQLLCDSLVNYHDLDVRRQVDLVALLSSLCLYPAVCKYVPEMSAEQIATDDACAALGYFRANARFMLNQDYDAPYRLDEFRTLAEHAPLGTVTRFDAQIHLIVQSARFIKDVAAVESWSSVAFRELQGLQQEFDDFTYSLLMSRYYRAASFASQMRGNRVQIVREMDLAEEYANSLPRDTEVRRILADENIHPLMQSRSKEAVWLGELELAEHRARRVLEVDPLDPRAHIELAEILLTRDKIAEAAANYRKAAELGPPGTAIAWYMAGQCYETLGHLEHACDCFVSALKVDSFGVSAIERLVDLAKQTGNHALGRWAELRIGELKQKGTQKLH